MIPLFICVMSANLALLAPTGDASAPDTHPIARIGEASSTTLPLRSAPQPPPPGLAQASLKRPCGLTVKPRATRHVVWIWFENQNPRLALGGSQTSSLASQCGSTSNYFGVTHPSLPNYLAAVTGSTQGIIKNCWCQIAAPSLFSQVSWRLYAQSMPYNCDLNDDLPYEGHHNVAVHFAAAGCAQDDVPMKNFWTDLARRRLPAFTFLLPDVCHDMHFTHLLRCSTKQRETANVAMQAGNVWLAAVLARVLRSSTYRAGHTVIFITWDEGNPTEPFGEECAQTRSKDCRTALLVIAPSVKPGTVDDRFLNAYSLLGTTEHMLGVPRIGAAQTATGMWRAFNL